MRLIDADKLLEFLNGYAEGISKYMEEHEFFKGTAQIATVWSLIQAVEEFEKVDAIPVEWIEEWGKREENYYAYKDLTRFIIEDWRKENEHGTCSN